jgi:glycosyltransferase involved in cell wall biosynthesis
MTKLLVEGWRGINHSYSLVNQYQIRELIKLGFIVHHTDVPFYQAHWERQKNNSGFPAHDHDAIMALGSVDADQADIIYRIAVPFRIAPVANKKVFVFGTSETQKIPDGVIQPSAIASIKDQNITIVTPSAWSKEGFVRYGFTSENVIVIPHGVDTEIYKPIDTDVRLDVRRRLGIGDDEILFLSVGAMTPGKGIDLLLQAFVRLAEKYPEAKLLLKDQRNLYKTGAAEVVSRFIEKERSSKRMLNSDIFRRIVIIDHNLDLRQLALLYAASDCYVSPYRAEGFNLPPLEAAACGVPIIVTKGGSTDEYASPEFALKIESEIHRTDTGSYLEPRLDSIEEAMEEILTRNFKVDIRLAREAISTKFTWENAVRQLVEAFGQSCRNNEHYKIS